MMEIGQLSNFMEAHVDEERVRDALMAAKIDEMSIQIQTLTKQGKTRYNVGRYCTKMNGYINV